MRDFLTTLHLLTFQEILLVGGIALVWGIIAWRRAVFSDGFRSMLYVVAAIGIMEALLGIVLFLSGCRPTNMLHLVYGLIVAGAIPVAGAYTNETIAKRDLAVLAFAVFAIVAAAVRAFSTGVGGMCPS